MIKEEYFTKGNIGQKACSFIEKAARTTRIKDSKLCLKNSALLVLDMQEFFTDENSHAFVPSSKAIIPNIQSLIRQFKDNNMPVIFTRHINNKDNANLMASWWRDLIDENDQKSFITKDFDCSDSIVINKSQYDAFYNTDLEKILRNNGVKNVVITGVMAHLCCETTARSAFVRGFQPFFAIDATATYNEDFHRATVLNLSHGFAVPVLTDDITCHSML